MSEVHISFDLETLSLESNDAIIQIGATVVGTQSTYKIGIDPRSAENLGGHVCVSTLEWWNKQDPALRKQVFSGIADAQFALRDFFLWCNDQAAGDVNNLYLWSKGADYDCVVLKNAYEMFMSYPFNWRNHRCVRTAMHLSPHPNPVPNTQSHDALADAIYQAQFIAHALKI